MPLSEIKKRSPLNSRSPILPQPDSKSPGSVSQKTPTTLSRQGTLRASHRRKSSMTGSLNLYQGRRSPVGFLDQRSPQGRRSPVFLSHDRVRSPNGFPSSSPTIERRSPTDRRSPTFSIHTQDRRSPVTTAPITELQRRSPTSTVHVQDSRTYDLTPEDGARTPTMMIPIKRSSIGLFTPIPFSEKRSPVSSLPIPPITVSNPSETCKIVERMTESMIESIAEAAEEIKVKEPEKEVTEKKEKTSVMKEILAFVRKPSKKVTTRTGRFAAAFSRAESGSGSGPLIRQSTFSCSPAASSTAAKSAVTKQMSEVGFEPKMSLKFSLNTKMSLRLRRSTATSDDKKKDKAKTSGDETTPSGAEADKKYEQQVGGARSLPPIPFELENVHFEKVGDSYIKHEQIREEPSEEGSPIQIVALSNENAQMNILAEEKMEEEEGSPNERKESEARSRSPRLHDQRKAVTPTGDMYLDTGGITYDEEIRRSIEELRSEIEEHIKQLKPEPIYQNLLELRGEEEPSSASGFIPLQCPTFEIEPPSRRSSFDPPRSPFLENLRSPGVDTDTELMNLNRLDSGGDSFEMVDPDRNRESSFEDRYSSRDTSFDISRYQSTSYEDQTSSFEIVDIDIRQEDKRSNIDLRKSSIELVDPETFQRSGASTGRKSSLETHFDYNPSDILATSTGKAVFPLHGAKKTKTRSRDTHISPFNAFSRARSPLSNQTSSNYSSRDSYDSSSSYQQSHADQRSPYADHSRQHFPLTIKGHEEVRTFLCTDQRCASIFEPRPCTGTTSFLGGVGSGPNQTSSGSEFEPPSPRRAASASPKHTFTFRIVLKKVDSSPDAICPSAERRSRDRSDRFKRRDSRRKRLADAGKSF